MDIHDRQNSREDFLMCMDLNLLMQLEKEKTDLSTSSENILTCRRIFDDCLIMNFKHWMFGC
jgi:hypothetical protein